MTRRPANRNAANWQRQDRANLAASQEPVHTFRQRAAKTARLQGELMFSVWALRNATALGVCLAGRPAAQSPSVRCG